MTTTTPTAPDAPLPEGARCSDDWQPDTPQAYRIIHGETRGVVGYDGLVVWTAATQFADGALDVDRDPPTVSIDGLIWEHGLTSGQARELAATLIEASDELDGWVTR